jgi:hypothetical protein
MKHLLIVLLVCLFFQNSFSQDNRVPSQKQMQAQMKQAKTKAQKQIIDQENQIAEAEKNGASADEINEMKKNLATMKKMVGVIDNVASVNTKKKPETISTTNTVAPYKSPYIKFYNQPVITPTKEQAKDKLLWYRGKKINQNTLVTTNGRIIQYDRQNNRVLVQMNPRKDTNFLKVVSNLVKSRQWTQHYVNWKYAEKNSFFDYPSVMLAMERYDLIEKDYNKIVNNSLALPGTGTNPIADVMYETPTSHSGPSANFDNGIDPYVEQQYEYIKSLINNPPPLDVTPPPKDEFSLCYYCDPTAQERYYREKEIWSDAFNEYEAGIISRILGIERYYQLMGLDGDTEVGTMWTGELANAWKFASDRIERKIEILRQRYEDDIYRYAAVVSTILGWERQKQLLGFANGDEFTTTEFIIFKNGRCERFIDDRIAANDYDVIFNYAVVLGFARQKALLGYINDDDDEYQVIMEKIDKQNHFALTINIDFDLEYRDEEDTLHIKPNASISTPNKVYVSLGRNKDCKWQLFLFEPDFNTAVFSRNQEMLFKIPLKVNSGIKLQRKNGELVSYPYTGPADLAMDFPSMRISFCANSGPDSAIIENIRYEQENLSGDPANSYTVDLLGYLDKALISVTDTKNNSSEVMDIIGDMGSLSSQATVDHPTGYAKLDKMQVGFKMNGMQHDLLKRVKETTRANNTVLLFDAQNGSQFLINGQLNTAHEEYKIKVKSCIIKLKVVQEPL